MILVLNLLYLAGNKLITMKILILSLLLGISYLKGQQNLVYYPHLKEILLTDEDKEYNYFVYEKKNLIKDILKIAEKTFYSDFYFSNNVSGSSVFQSMKLVPLKQNIENFFLPGITLKLLGDRDHHIGLTYTQDFENEDYDQKSEKNYSYMKSVFRLDDGDKIAVSIPLNVLNSVIKNPELNGEFFISQLETFISKDKNVTLTAEGKFSKGFYLKNGKMNSLSVKKLVFEFTNNELLIKTIHMKTNESLYKTEVETVIYKTKYIL